jgi:hypothetical protein
VILLLVEQLFEGGFLAGTALQDQEHAVHRQTGGSRAAIVFSASQVIGIALQEREIVFVHGLSDAGRRGSGLREGAEREQRKESKKQENASETCGLGSHSFGHLGSHFGPVKTAWRVNGSYKKC